MDAYNNLINSRAIGDYCRRIKHEFNTEELAVLIYRNNKMSIDEKISKYKSLIQNYPDMEVIERINCKHYDSVKTLIKNEINRLEKLYKNLIKENDNAVYTWTEFNKSTLEVEYGRDIDNIARTYNEVQRSIKSYIKEYDDTISYRITKKYFDKRKSSIYADFVVEDKASKLVDIFEENNDFLDIDNIFLNIPTPFKKGDILISKNKTIKNCKEYGKIFVLDYLCTWKDNLEKILAKGNYDSSDMIGYGYGLIDENSTDFVMDHKLDYDSFEYYDGELKGNNRILKDISSFLKGKISLDLFIHAYDAFKAENARKLPDYYTDEGLRLAGFTETDIMKENHEEKITYNM